MMMLFTNTITRPTEMSTATTVILFFTALYGVGATAVYWIINRVSNNPQRVWLMVVIIGFVLTALPDLPV